MPYVGGSVAVFFGEGARQATADVARVMCKHGGDEAKRVSEINTPVKTGRLRASWYTTPVVADGASSKCEVRNDVEYAAYVEEGTGLWGPKHAPYIIRPKNPGGVLRWLAQDGSVVFARYAIHPGSPGNHMLKIGMLMAEASFATLVRDDLEMWVHAVEGLADRQV
jgi:hypothetical protein